MDATIRRPRVVNGRPAASVARQFVEGHGVNSRRASPLARLLESTLQIFARRALLPQIHPATTWRPAQTGARMRLCCAAQTLLVFHRSGPSALTMPPTAPSADLSTRCSTPIARHPASMVGECAIGSGGWPKRKRASLTLTQPSPAIGDVIATAAVSLIGTAPNEGARTDGRLHRSVRAAAAGRRPDLDKYWGRDDCWSQYAEAPRCVCRFDTASTARSTPRS